MRPKVSRRKFVRITATGAAALAIVPGRFISIEPLSGAWPEKQRRRDQGSQSPGRIGFVFSPPF
ncbi:MAG TPA: twin-arginine translocation signal domain-containing protein [Bacteroidales bacterium]|jgi:hypothetical protein|nr:twin-arginine translocation signal domain-containing protein [Bacteroidales bacterium]